MPREASGTYALSSRSSISVTKPLSRATPGVAAPRLSSGIYAPAVGTIPRLSRRENRSNVRPLARTNRERGKRKRERERERERKKRDEILQDGRNFTLADGDDYDVSLPALAFPVMFRACHPRRWSCQPYRNRYPPVVCLSGSLYPHECLGLDIFPSRLHFTLLT